MGMFGATNEDLENLKSDIKLMIFQDLENLKHLIESKIHQVETSIGIRATDSEESARLAAQNSIEYAHTANEAGINVQAALQEINNYKNSASIELESLRDEISSVSLLNTKLQQEIVVTQNLYTRLIEAKENIENKIADLSEKLESANDYISLAEKLPDAVEQAKNSLSEAKTLGESIKNTLGHAVSRKSEIDELHKLILGEDINDSDGISQHVDGLKDELEATYKQLADAASAVEITTKDAISKLTDKHNSLLNENKNNYELLLTNASARYDQVNTQLTGLLPGAMAEGLSAAYDKKKDSEEVSLSKFEQRFSYAIYGLVAISVIPFTVDIYLLAFEGRDLVQVIKDTPSLIVSILPIYFPVLWLAYSTSKKGNLSKRLIEEYTHKSVLGKTFSGLSNQIETLEHQGVVKEELRTKLLFNVLQVSAENPGKLITDYNRSDHPLMDALEKSSKLSDSLETLSKIPGLSAIVKKLSEKGDIDLKRQSQKVEDGLLANEKL